MQTMNEPCKTIRHFKGAADYRKNFVIREQIDKYLPGGKHFIDDGEMAVTCWVLP